MFTRLAIKSLLDRKGSVLLALLAMSVSVFVLVGVEHIRHQAKQSFSSTVSGVDLIVGARTGSLNLLMYSVFRIGNATNNISWQSYKEVTADPNVKWAIPFSLGDSHRGYRVLGTSQAYFDYFSFGQKQKIAFSEGKPFTELFDIVLGFEVAKALGYELGDKIVVAHGLAATSFSLHDDRPFTVTGILAPTGTPIDQTLHVSLEAIEAIHIDWKQGVKIPNSQITTEQLVQAQFEPKAITAFMLGLKSRIATFKVQRGINNYRGEPLMAILPGVALSELWQTMGVLENTLLLVSVLVFIAASLGVSAMLLSSIRERQSEIQLLRVIGAPPWFIFLLVELEALMITLLSIVLGTMLLWLTLLYSQESLISTFGLRIDSSLFNQRTLLIGLAVMSASFIASLVPSIVAFRRSVRLNT